MKKSLSFILSIVLFCSIFTAAYAQPLTPSEPSNDVVDAEIIYVPLKNRIVFSYGSSNLPNGIILKLTYSDGTEKTETIVRTDYGYYAGEESIIGAVHPAVVSYGFHTETLYINETVGVEYDYFVIPPVRSIIYIILDVIFPFEVIVKPII